MGILMSLLKQAKTLSKRQIALTTALLQQTRYPARNLAIFLLSIKAGCEPRRLRRSRGTWSQTLKGTWDQRFISETKPAKVRLAGSFP